VSNLRGLSDPASERCWPERKEKEKKKKNYAGSKTLPASIKEKEAHWPEVPDI
jgi:hypothetical protein